MKDTFIYCCEATFRSLNSNPTEKGTQKEKRERFGFCRYGQPAFAMLLILVLALIACGRLDAAEPKNVDGKTSKTDLLRQDIVRLAGPVTDRNVQNVAVPQDGFLVRLNRKAPTQAGEIPTTYGMIVRGVDPVEQALLQDAMDGKWDNFDLFRAAMIVEGIRDENKIRQYEARLDAIRTKAGDVQDGKVRDKAELTRELFETLHRDLLTKPYDINSTHLGRVFETGHFNCVSATVLFNILAEKAGLDVCALEMPGHALSRVRFVDQYGNGQAMNLETTAPNWFAIQSESARAAATVHRVARPTPALPLPATANRQAATENTVDADKVDELNNLSKNLREITPVQLIATIYYNQGVDLLEKKQFAEAARANIKALLLDPSSETAWGNLMATINNWSIDLTTQSKRYDLAATLLDQGVYLDPNYDKFRANQLHVYYHWIRDLALEGRVADAKTVFALADQRLPNDPDLRNLMQAIEKK